eukprot:526142_1
MCVPPGCEHILNILYTQIQDEYKEKDIVLISSPITKKIINCTHNIKWIANDATQYALCPKLKSCVVQNLISINHGAYRRAPNLIGMKYPYQSDEYKCWSAYNAEMDLLCSECWLSILPVQLPIILQHIVDHIAAYHSLFIKEVRNGKRNMIAMESIDNPVTYLHFLFMQKLLSVGSGVMMQYIFRHNSIYSLIFKYMQMLMQMVFCSDLFLAKHDKIVLIHQIMTGIRNGFFISTFSFWKKKHNKYYLKRLVRLIRNDIMYSFMNLQ